MKQTLLTRIAATTVAAATAVLGFSNAASAFEFGTGGISFEEDTWLSFTFKQNGGWFDSTLAVYKVLDNGSTSKVKDLVGEELDSTASYTFTAGTVYTLGLTSTRPDNDRQLRTIYSTTSLNFGYRNGGAGYQQAVFGYQPGLDAEAQALANPGDYTQGSNPTEGTVKISFEDVAIPFRSDADYNDFVVYAAPEPITMGGMALGAAGLAMARRRRGKKSA